ncbi:MAG: hypothetical protein JO353_06980 [Phycisphaerae bacterium]|nr:hypothetical protein [Phycisphaerae bacterium]
MNRRVFPEWGMGLVDLDAPMNVDLIRLRGLLDHVRAASDTARLSVEARMLINDFKMQVLKSAA